MTEVQLVDPNVPIVIGFIVLLTIVVWNWMHKGARYVEVQSEDGRASVTLRISKKSMKGPNLLLLRGATRAEDQMFELVPGTDVEVNIPRTVMKGRKYLVRKGILTSFHGTTPVVSSEKIDDITSRFIPDREKWQLMLATALADLEPSTREEAIKTIVPRLTVESQSLKHDIRLGLQDAVTLTDGNAGIVRMMSDKTIRDLAAANRPLDREFLAKLVIGSVGGTGLVLFLTMLILNFTTGAQS